MWWFRFELIVLREYEIMLFFNYSEFAFKILKFEIIILRVIIIIGHCQVFANALIFYHCLNTRYRACDWEYFKTVWTHSQVFAPVDFVIFCTFKSGKNRGYGSIVQSALRISPTALARILKVTGNKNDLRLTSVFEFRCSFVNHATRTSVNVYNLSRNM
jgi:hypothetical protein